MKAEIAVRSSSASISACTAPIAPLTISTVTGSHAAGTGRAASVERSIGRILDGKQGGAADDGGSDHVESGGHRAAGLADQEGGDEGRKTAEDRDREAIADRERGEAHLGREQ